MVHAGCNGVLNGEGPGVPLCDGFSWYVTAWSLDVGSGTGFQAADAGMMEMLEVAMATAPLAPAMARATVRRSAITRSSQPVERCGEANEPG